MAKSKRERQERRFFPHSSANPKIVAIVGGIGALILGAGAFGQFGTMKMVETSQFVPWMLAVGTALIGVAFWFGTSGEPPLLVGDAGVGIDRGTTPRHIPWYAVESLAWDGSARADVVKGVDEATVPLTVTAKLASHPLAAAWIVKEGTARVPKVVNVPEEIAGELTQTGEADGDARRLEPLQVVGRRCAASDKIISFEPDARLCTRCERVYHKNSVPKKCRCGASLGGGKSKTGDEDAA